MKVLVLCHGNVNRSPLCAQVLRQDTHYIPFFEVRSAGFGKSNQRASKKTRDLALNLGYSLEDHRSLQVNKEMVAWANLVIYMDGGNRKRLVELAPEVFGLGEVLGKPYGMSASKVAAYAQKAHCLGEWDVPESKRIPDPAFMAKDSPGFEKAIRTVIGCSQRLASWLDGQP